jgi:hypothetical protein
MGSRGDKSHRVRDPRKRENAPRQGCECWDHQRMFPSRKVLEIPTEAFDGSRWVEMVRPR